MSEELEWPVSGPSSTTALPGGVLDRRTQGDVRLFHEPDGGEIKCEGGIIELTQAPDTAAYLSMLGGNEDDSALADGDREQWWANFEELDRRRHQRSRTQFVLDGFPCTPENLSILEDAVRTDLAWMVDELGAAITVSASIAGINRAVVAGSIDIAGTKYPFRIPAPWGAT